MAKFKAGDKAIFIEGIEDFLDSFITLQKVQIQKVLPKGYDIGINDFDRYAYEDDGVMRYSQSRLEVSKKEIFTEEEAQQKLKEWLDGK